MPCCGSGSRRIRIILQDPDRHASPIRIRISNNSKHMYFLLFSRKFQYAVQNTFNPGTFTSVPEIIDPVFAKTSQNARFLLSENERFGLVFVKTGSIKSGTDEK